MKSKPEILDEEIIALVKDLNSTSVGEIANIIKASHTYTFNRLISLSHNGLINLHKTEEDKWIFTTKEEDL